MEIRALRDKRGHTQADMADLLDLSRSGYQLYERGTRGMPLDVFYALAELLGVRASYILSEAEKDFAEVFEKTRPPRPELTRAKAVELRPRSARKDQPGR